MVHSRTRTLCFAGLLLILAASGARADGVLEGGHPDAGGSLPPLDVGRSGDGCTLVTFEGLGDVEPVPVIVGDVTVTFGASWLSTIDLDAGGIGNFANEPTPSTAAAYLDTSDLSVQLAPAVQFVEFFYSASAASVPVTLTAFDAGDQVVDVAVGNTVGSSLDGAACNGDPNGEFCLWGTVTLNAATNDIVRIEITGSTANQIAFDNMRFCLAPEATGACCLPTGPCSQTSAANCAAAGGTFHPLQDCGQVECGAVSAGSSVESSSWGRAKARYRR